MTLFEVVDQLKAVGYDNEAFGGRQIIVTSGVRLRSSCKSIRSVMSYTDILVVDGKIVKDRTGRLDGERYDMQQFMKDMGV